MRRNQRSQSFGQFRGLLKLLHKAREIQRSRFRLGFLLWTNTTQIRICIEGCLKLLGIDLSIFVQDMSVDAGDHVDLRVAGIALGGFQVAVVQLQLVGGTGVAQRMENHLWQPCFLTELRKLLQDDPVLAGAAIGQGNYQIELLIFVSQEASQLVLRSFPFPEDIGQRLRQPHLSGTGISLGFFRIILVLVLGISGVKI